jgi:hypothetical protein
MFTGSCAAFCAGSFTAVSFESSDDSDNDFRSDFFAPPIALYKDHEHIEPNDGSRVTQ